MVTEPGWAATEERLGDLLGELPADAQLTLHEVARPGDGPLVQLWQRPDALHALCDGERLPAAQREPALGDLGWQPPSGNYPQWWVRLDWPAPAAGYRHLARRLVATLRDGHGLASPDAVAYELLHPPYERRSAPLHLRQLEIRYYLRLGPGDSTDRPAGVLRRIRVDGLADRDEAIGPDGGWRPTETLELADLGELDDKLLEVGAATAKQAVATARARAAETVAWRAREAAERTARAADPLRPRLARSVDADLDDTGRPIVDRPLAHPAERDALAGYLRDAPLVAVAYGFDRDPFDPARPEVVPLHMHTDGVWVWSESLAYFAQRYGITPEPDFLAHLAQRRYRLPEVTEADIDRAMDLLRG